MYVYVPQKKSPRQNLKTPPLRPGPAKAEAAGNRAAAAAKAAATELGGAEVWAIMGPWNPDTMRMIGAALYSMACYDTVCCVITLQHENHPQHHVEANIQT